MSWIKRFAVCAAAIGALAVSGATAMADYARGYFNNWANDCPLTRPEGGTYYSGTLQAHVGQDPGLKFDLDGNWGSTVWGGTAAMAATVNGTTGNVSRSESGNIPMDVTDGYYYTFHLAGDWDWGDRTYLVMKTKYQPASFLNVTNDHETAFEDDVTVTANCSAGTAVQISPEETLYIQYTVDDWATKHLVAMTGSGLTRSGTIPGQTADTTVKYIVFSSTMPSNLFTDAVIYSSPANLDRLGFCMLAVANGGTPYEYTTESEYMDYMAGNAWHCPTNTEPYASATMRAPLDVALGDRPFVRLGVYPTSGSDAPTKVQLKYKAGTNAWATLTMKPEPHGDGWQPKYDGNDYYTNCITTNKFTVGMTVQYYFYVEYTNSSQFAETSVGTTDQRGSIAYLGANEAKSHPFEFTVGAAPVLPLANHVWHVPNEYPAGWETPMRNPYVLSEGVTNVAVFLGNYQADTDGENLTGGSIFYSIDGGAFAEQPLGWGSEMRNSDNNGYLKFWKYDIDTTGVTAGQTLRYYFAANVDGHATTYVISDGAGGMVRTNAVDPTTDNLFTATCGGRVYNLGNCWHVPGQFEPWVGAPMRSPCYPSAGEAICIFVGNQAYGDGNRGDMTGGTLYHRAAGASSWSQVALVPENRPDWDDPAWTGGGNNIYWKGIIPADTYASAGNMEYYVEVEYLNDYHDTTYLGTTNTWRSAAFGTAADAQAHPFTCPIGGEAGTEPGFMWHAGNVVPVGTNGNAAQFWVKLGYTKDGVDWANQVELRYNFRNGSAPRGAVRTGRSAKKAMTRELSSYSTAAFTRDHEEDDPSDNGNTVWWVCTLTDQRFTNSNMYLEYEIAAKNTDVQGAPWRFADYRTGSATNLFYYTMFQAGSGALTVNGLNADYTTSKFFIDEAAGETVTLNIEYSTPVGSPYAVEVFSNVGRRDYWDSDIDHNGVVDSIYPPDGKWVVAGMQDEANEPIHTNRPYFAAWPMDHVGDKWQKTLVVSNTGAYRLTARYKESEDGEWQYYSAITNSLRDHAIVISPKKVLRQNVYEVNGMTAKASAANEDGHSTFNDLIEGADSFAEFGIPYLNKIQVNCLWFQPIHTSSEYGLGPGGEPGSPYAAKDYFSVSKWYGAKVNGQRTTEQAMKEFTSFVAACDAGKSPSMSTSYVGTINIMLDGVFNHTSWDAVFGVKGEEMGIVPAGQGATTRIASRMPDWYARRNAYGMPATTYTGPESWNNDIAYGPDRGDFGKWEDTAELYYGSYSALVKSNPDDNGAYLNEDDQYDYTTMSSNTVKLWEYMGSYVPYWLDKTGHNFGNEHMGETDANGTALDDYGIDGLRCDFGQGLPPQFWEYCVNRARAKKWNFMFMAESLDGGKVSYRSNRHFDILNESFVFAARNAGSPADLVNVLNGKKDAYNGGTILLNLTSHDEVMPYTDPWMTVSRYAMLATVKGLPMTMYGQEQGIIPCNWGSDWAGEGTIITNIVSGDDFTSFGFEKFELNFGKWVADFKTWNKLLIWDNPPLGAENSRGMAQLYGRLNWARLNSPALQSDREYLLDVFRDGYAGGYSPHIWAMAKADRERPLQDNGDAVLSFVKFVHDGADHGISEDTFYLAGGVADFLGIEDDATYEGRNLASADAGAVEWTHTGAELKANGLLVTLTGQDSTHALYSDGALAKFFRVTKVVPPATHEITVTVGANGSVSPSGTVSVEDGADQEFVIAADTGYRIASVLADGVAVAEFVNDDTSYYYTWENVTADGTLEVAFTPQVWTISVSGGSNGSVTPFGDVLVQSGEGREFVVTADDGYRIESVLVDGTPVRTFEDCDTTYTYTWYNVTADGTLSASFVERVLPSDGGVGVPFTWMEWYYPDLTYAQMETAVNETGANGHKVWESYIAALDPTDPDDKMLVGQNIDLDAAKVSFDVTVPPGRTAEVRYVQDMTSTNWLSFEAPVIGTHTTSASATEADTWEFKDTSWDGQEIRFYRIQMKFAE